MSEPLSTRQPAVLELFGPKNAQRPVVQTDGALQPAQGKEMGCAVLEIPHQPWTNAKGTYYPEEELDRLDRWRFTIRNDSKHEATLPVMFTDERPPAITGFTPLLCDGDGSPTGIPVQISKKLACTAKQGRAAASRAVVPRLHLCPFAAALAT